ncbi:KTSC domain-containing protein [Candidatus Poribacteria bacterium]|nr:KTSC domain-containing protein [Candidatus Poribacteria bacterium]
MPVRYDEATGTLDVAFKWSGVYRYHDVPKVCGRPSRRATI